MPVKGIAISTGSARAVVNGVGALPAALQSNPPDVYFNNRTGVVFIKSAGTSIPSRYSCSRASPATQVDGTGVYRQFTNNLLATSSLYGASVWESRTNSIRNNMLIGAVAGVLGSGGLLPNNWTTSGLSWATVTIGATVTINGLPFLPVRIQGVPSSTGPFSIGFEPETSAGVAGSYGQTWAMSQIVMLSAGSLTNVVSTAIGFRENNNAGSGLATGQLTVFTPDATFTRRTGARTLQNSATTVVNTNFRWNSTDTVTAQDFTILIGAPQLELCNQIQSGVASATIAAAGSGGTDGTGVYSVGGGTGTAATLNVTVTGGVLTAINSVASAGTYTAFPPSPAALTYVSGTATGLTGATVNLTPIDRSAQGSASPLILTSGAAVTRAGETDLLTGFSATTAISGYMKVTPRAPAATNGTSGHSLFDISDGTTNNRITLTRAQNGTLQLQSTAGGSNNATVSAGAMAKDTTYKVSFAIQANDQAVCLNGAAPTTGASLTFPSGPINVFGVAGRFSGGVQNANGDIEEGALWFNARNSNGFLQSSTT